MTIDPLKIKVQSVLKLKVLLIDDEPLIRTTLSQLLNTFGLKNIYEADSVKSGLKETFRIRPDLVFCDIHMPDEDGFAYVAEIRNSPLPGIASTSVVMLTSDAQRETVLAAKELDVSRYMLKPITVAAVQIALELALNERDG